MERWCKVEEYRRKLEIGSCSERLKVVRDLGGLHSREAYELLEFAARDTDQQVREEAHRFMQESCWYTGSAGIAANASIDEEDNQTPLF